MKVYFSDRAQADIEAIADYIARDNRKRALSFARELRKRCRDIGLFPLSCPLIPYFETKGYRRAIYGRYLIFYRIRNDAVEIGFVMNGATDYLPVLFPDTANDT